MAIDFSAARQNYLDIPAVAARLGVSETTIRNMIAERKIGHYRIGSRGGRIFVTEAQLDDAIQSARVQPLQARAAA